MNFVLVHLNKLEWWCARNIDTSDAVVSFGVYYYYYYYYLAHGWCACYSGLIFMLSAMDLMVFGMSTSASF